MTPIDARAEASLSGEPHEQGKSAGWSVHAPAHPGRG